MSARQELPATHPTIAIFARYPESGKVKTRLAATIGNDAAAAAYQEMIRILLTGLDEAGILLRMYITGAAQEAFESMFGSDRIYIDQGEGDLGARMERCLENERILNDGKSLLIGSDAPDIPTEVLSEAWEALDEADLVLGPAVDGGYYLIGLRCRAPELFRDIAWGTNSVCEVTSRRAKETGLSLCMMRAWNDIDTAEDWNRFVSRGNRIG